VTTSTAQRITAFLLAAPSCGQARAGETCHCGCINTLSRAVQEMVEAELQQGIIEHRGDICATYPPSEQK
jgi:hypothetical protein